MKSVAPEDHEDAPAFVMPGQEATMVGDLDKIPLTDVFQTLAMSKMEGILVVFNPLEQRGLYFRDGNVRDLVFGRPEHRRLGERLRHAGMISMEQLRSALHAQEVSHRPLGFELIEQGAIEPDDLVNMVHYQASEDLHSLFTWQHGTFEFYKGTPEDPRVVARIEAVQQFKVDAILLEAARRNDEWAEILDALHSADEILRPVDGCDASQLEGDPATVMAMVNGARSIRELTEHTVLGVFHCAHVCKTLLQWGMVEPVGPHELLDAAEQQRRRGDVRKAVVTLRTLFDRDERLLDLDTVRELAAAMERCGDSRFAGRVLWRAAEAPGHEDESLQLMRDACRVDTRSSYLLRSLQRVLQRHGIVDDELVDVTSRLADALVAEDQEDEAVAEIERLRKICAEPREFLGRKARVLQKLGRNDEAVDALDELAQHLQAGKDRAQLIALYERILMLDARRKDVAKALAKLRTTKRARQVRLVVAIAVLGALGSGGVVYLQHTGEMERLQSRLGQLERAIEAGQLTGLETEIDGALSEFGAYPQLEDLRARVVAQRELLASQRERDHQEQVRGRLAEAADHLERGRLPAALQIYRELMGHESSREQATGVATTRISGLTSSLERLASSLPGQVPEPPTDLQTTQQREAELAKFRIFFKATDLELARGLQQVADHPVLLDLLGPEKRNRLIQQAETVEMAFVHAQTRERAYRAAEKQVSTKQLLQPVFLAAQRHEEAHEFAEALAAYRKLVAEYPDEDRLKADFRDKAARYAWIQDRMNALAAATAKGQHQVALDRLAELSAREPDIPFDTLVHLPLKIESTPPGAVVTVNGESVGRTPTVTSYVARGPTVLDVHLPGFRPYKVQLAADFPGEANMLLTKAPDWANVAPGSVERQPICSEDGHAFLVDRSGTLTCIALENGDIAWKLRTEDLSGLLTRPAIVGSRVVVGSFDGPLRAIDSATGGVAWKADELPCESGPAAVGSVLVVATIRGEAVGVRPDSGKAVYRTRLPGPVGADIATDGRHAYLVTRNGWVVCLDGASGKIAWSRQIADNFAAGAAVQSGVVVVASDDGTVAGLAAGDGRTLWQQTGLGELTLTPAQHGGRAIVAGTFTIHTFDLRDGRRGPRFKGEQPWSSAPQLADDKLFVGNQAGVVYVLDPTTLSRRYALRGQGRISAPLGISRAGKALAAFESKVLQGFRQLP